MDEGRVRARASRWLMGLALLTGCGGQARSTPDADRSTSGAGEDPGSDGNGGSVGAEVEQISFRTIEAGFDEYCGITRDDGRLLCIHDGEVSFEARGPFVSFDMNDQVAEWDYRCAVRDTGALFCFGALDLAPPEGAFSEVRVGAFNACARSSEGVECWVPVELGGIESPIGAGLDFSVNMWSFCTVIDMMHGYCTGRDGEDLLPREGHYLATVAVPSAGCGAVFGGAAEEGAPDPSTRDEILLRNGVACMDANEGRWKLAGLYLLLDANVNEDGCAFGLQEGETEASVACWGAFENSVPPDHGDDVVAISVSLGQVCLLDSQGLVTCFPSR